VNGVVFLYKAVGTVFHTDGYGPEVMSASDPKQTLLSCCNLQINDVAVSNALTVCEYCAAMLDPFKP
jgi:hypothetical protein